jgi:hypothetical protein
MLPLPGFGSLGRLKLRERDALGSALRMLLIELPRPLAADRATSAPARPASAAPPASNGVFALRATLPTLFAAVPTLLAPVAAVSFTVSPTDPAVLCPFRDVERLLAARPVDLAREPLADGRLREEDDRARVELRELELRELDAFEPDALREFDAFVLLLEPFREPLLLEPLDVLLRRVVLAFACAIL